MVCDFAHLLCTVKFEKEDAPLLTNYLYVWTFAFCLFQYKRKKEQKRCFNDFGDMQEFCMVQSLVTISITISMSFFLVNVILVNHVSYYITVYLNDVRLVYGLDICVQGGDVRVSTGRCFIFVMKYIKLTYIQAGILFISYVVVECMYLIHWKKDAKMWSGGGKYEGEKNSSAS